MRNKVQGDVLSQKVKSPYLKMCAPPKHIQKNNDRSGRMSPCTLMRASITIEAALILPFFIGILLSFFVLFMRCEQEARLAAAVSTEAKELAVLWGIAGTDGSRDQVVLIKTGKSSLPFGMPLIWDDTLCESAFCRAWIGYEKRNQESSEMMVYITPEGSVYHLWEDCSHLELTIQKVSLVKALIMKNQNGEKYRKCERCRQEMGIYVYITDEGNCYHASRLCSGLKRDVRCVSISKAAGRSCCLRCRAREEERG